MKKRTAAVLLLAGLVLAACGTRLPDEAFVESGQVVGSGDVAAGDGDGGRGTAEDLETGTDGATDTTVAGEAAGDAGATTGGDAGGATGGATGGDGGTGGGGAAGPNQASDVGITANQIVLGNITAETGVLDDAFAPSARGMRAWAAWINAKGGINGRQVVLKTCDDGEVRNKALECARRLVEQDKVFAIVGANTRAMGGAAQYLNDQGVPVVGMPINNSYYRYPHFWAGYPFGYKRDGTTVGQDGKLATTTGIYRWFRQNLKIDKAAVFAYDIAESKQAGDQFAQGLREEGFQVKTYLVSFAAPSFDQAVASMQQDGTQLIMDAMDDGANRKLCDAMARRNFSVTAKVSTVVSFGQKVGTAYNETCRNSVFIPGESIPYTANVPAVKEFRDAFARYQPGKEVHQWALEAWGQAQMVREGIEKMGAAPTRKGLEDFFRSLDGYTANGLFVGLGWKVRDYSAPTAANDCFSIARWQDDKGGWVLATGAFPFCYASTKQFLTPALEQGN